MSAVAAVAAAAAAADASVERLHLELELELPEDAAASLPRLELELAAAGSPRRDSVQEAPLRAAIKAIQHKCALDMEAFQMLHEVCQETLLCRKRMARLPIHASRGNSVADNGTDENGLAPVISSSNLSAPKSPQERLMALVPAAIEKGRSRYHRRTSPARNGTDAISRWQRTDSDAVPITDITVIFAGDPVPEGFTKIERSPSGTRADLNKGARGVFIYLCVGRDASATKTPINEIVAVFPERGEFVPPDYEVVQRRGAPANLNSGTQGEKVYLCFRRSMSSSVVDVMVLFPKKGDRLPYGYTKIDITPDGHKADLNSNSGGVEVFISYKKKLSCISDMHKKWLRITTLSQHDTACSPRPPSPSSARDGASPQKGSQMSLTSDGQKLGEIRADEVTEPTLPQQADFDIMMLDWTTTVEYYMYPILLACYTRHGKVAEVALEVLAQCLDAGFFDEAKPGSSCSHIGVLIDGVTSCCQQAIKSRFVLALPLFRKVIRKSVGGFNTGILHSILKALTFIGDLDSTVVKSVEDELIYKIMNRYEAENAQRQFPTFLHEVEIHSTSTDMVREFVCSLVDDVSTGVEIAAATESVLGSFKSHASIQSSQFCSDISEGLNSLAHTTLERNAFQLVVTLCKVVHRKVSAATDTTTGNDRWYGNHSLRALNVVLLAAGAASREKRVFGQLVRRFVFATVNSASLTGNHDAFRGNLVLISTLWNHYRRHLKVELALVFEHIFLRILKSPAPCAINYQLDIIHELLPWFQLAPNIIEMFLNFDLDRVQQWKIFEHLCSTVCSIAEGTSTATPPSPDDDHKLRSQIQIQAITTVLAIARSVMDASGHAHLINRDARTRLLSMEVGGWEQDDDTFVVPSCPTDAAPGDNPLATLDDSTTQLASLPFTEKLTGPHGRESSTVGIRFGSMSVRMRNEVQKRNQQILRRAMEISSAKSLKKAIEYLIAMNFVKDTPRDITSFLRIYHDFFDEAELGDYLGEGDEDFKVQVRLTYVRAISFEGMTLVESLRHFLTNGGFRLPGEAQKIERMVEAFAQCFYEDSPTSFSSADTAMIIAYSIIMLNTDLHNPQVKKNKMSKEQFVKNNRGIDNGKDLPRRFLEEIYDDILRNPMHIKGRRFVPKTSREASLSARDVENGTFRVGLAKSVAQSEELMKDLSQSYVTFQFVGVDACISPDLIKLLFERVWFFFHALSTSILGDNRSDLSMTMHCLDLLRFCISTCLFLRMPVERQAFCTLLNKVESSLDDTSSQSEDEDSESAIDGEDATSAEECDTIATTIDGKSQKKRQQEWLRSVEDAAVNDDPWLAMGDIHMVVNKMKETIQHRQRSQELSSVLRRINRSSYYLKDTTQFIREGDLVKKCRSRNRVYRFFLFNDQLLYADKSISGNWNPHNSLRLKLTRVSDVPDSVMHKYAFHIQNPTKSFIVFADSASGKAEWVRAIDEAITEGTKKISRNARRISTKAVAGSIDDSAPAASSSVIGILRRSSRLASTSSSPPRPASTQTVPVEASIPFEDTEATLPPAPASVKVDDDANAVHTPTGSEEQCDGCGDGDNSAQTDEGSLAAPTASEAVPDQVLAQDEPDDINSADAWSLE